MNMGDIYPCDELDKCWGDWRWQLKNSLSGKGAISCLEKMGLDCSGAEAVEDAYPILVSPYYLSLVESYSQSDPIALQCFPSSEELLDGCSSDPFLEHQNMPVPGLVHRFRDRVLLLACSACAVNCRHCTRKNWITDTDKTAPSNMSSIIEYLRLHEEVREVIVSGGDPLMLETSELESILEGIVAIKHVKVLRLGTRVPVTLPMRVDQELCSMLRKFRPLWVNTQFNHSAEITDDSMRACRQLIDSGIPVSNQSVLLRGVNDSEEECERLFTLLQENMIRPYYMFLCDPVKGTTHFRVSVEEGRRIEEALRVKVGGMALPKFVADFPEENGKVQMSSI